MAAFVVDVLGFLLSSGLPFLTLNLQPLSEAARGPTEVRIGN